MIRAFASALRARLLAPTLLARDTAFAAAHPPSTYDASAAATPMESLRPMQQLLVAVYVGVALAYLGWRATTLNPAAPVFSVLVYGAELFGLVTTLLHLFMVWRLTVRKAPPARPGLAVDIFVPSYNEPTDLVRRTLLAARNVDYPHQTWLLDDGRRPEMEAMARELGVRYLTRPDNRHAKAGNLNHALSHSTAELIAIFDADHAPKRNFLDETLGFFDDPAVAFVQTPQDFFNLDSYQHRKRRTGPIWTEQSLFFRVIQRGKDGWNAAFFCGSCAVIRRSALDRMGGFATATITEDLETSVKLHAAGYRSVYVEQALAFGIAPSAAVPFLTQRIRWGQGAMQVIRQTAFFMRPKLALAQRLNYVASALTYFEGWSKAIFYLAPAYVLLTGTMPIVATASEFLPRFLPFLVLTFVVFEEVGRGYGRSAMIEQYNMARFAAFCWATVGLVRRNLRFRVTSKDNVSATEVEMRMVSPQIAIAAVNGVAIVVGVAIFAFRPHLPEDGLIANVIWAFANFALASLVVRFTFWRSRYRRREYRFPVPLPAFVTFGGQRVLMTVDDVSSSGCRLYGAFPPSLAPGERVCGTLLLPGDGLAFEAVVASRIPGGTGGDTYVKAIGVTFGWKDQASRDRLDLFLYGSDLQWLLHATTDRIRTPGEALAAWLGIASTVRQDIEHWSAAFLELADADAEPALLSRPHAASAPRIVASYRRIVGAPSATLRESTRTGSSELVLRPVREIARIHTPLAAIYLTEMRPCRT